MDNNEVYNDIVPNLNCAEATLIELFEQHMNPERDPFLKVIKKHRNNIQNSVLASNYDKFIKEYDSPQEYRVAFFGGEGSWCDPYGEWHADYFCYRIWPSDVGNLDPKLLILYSLYFIKRFGFLAWFDAFAGEENQEYRGDEEGLILYGSKANRYLSYIQENVSELPLNDTEKEIVLKGIPLERTEYNYDLFCDPEGGKTYTMDKKGRMHQ